MQYSPVEFVVATDWECAEYGVVLTPVSSKYFDPLAAEQKGSVMEQTFLTNFAMLGFGKAVLRRAT